MGAQEQKKELTAVQAECKRLEETRDAKRRDIDRASAQGTGAAPSSDAKPE